jgi:hypothetical protein
MLIMLAGIVSTYFQFASHHRCMKHRMTSIALAHDTAIIMAHMTTGEFSRSVWLLPTAYDTPVSAHRATKTARYFISPPGA